MRNWIFIIVFFLASPAFSRDDLGDRVYDCMFQQDHECVIQTISLPNYNPTINYDNLFTFIIFNNLKLVERFFQLPGVNINAPFYEWNPLMMAVESANRCGDWHIASWLILKGAKPDLPAVKNGKTPRSMNPAAIAAIEKNFPHH